MDFQSNRQAVDCKVYVGNVPDKAKAWQLRHFFGKFGHVVHCSIPRNAMPNRRYAFVTFQNADEAEHVRKVSAEELVFGKRTLNVQPALPIRNKRMTTHSTSLVGQETERAFQSTKGAITERPTGMTVEDLNDDCLLLVFSFLDFPERVKLERVSRRWQCLSRSLWMLQQELPLQKMFNGLTSVQLTSGVLWKILQRCKKNITRLNFTYTANKLTDRSGHCISKLCPKLETLDATGADFGRKSLTAIGKNCRMLKHFSFRHCRTPGETTFCAFFNNARNLETLELCSCYGLSSECFRHISSNLTRITLSQCPDVLPESILMLATSCLELRELVLDHCPLVLNSDVLEVVCARLTKLQVLTILGACSSVSMDSAMRIANLKDLTELRLFNSSFVSDEVLAAVVHGCRGLQVLDVGGRRNDVTKAGIELLSSLPYLRELHLDAVSVQNDTFPLLERCCTLDTLSLRGNFTINDSVTESLLSNLQLVHLDLGGCAAVTNGTLHSAIRYLTENPTKELKLCLGETGCKKNARDYPALPQSLTVDYSFTFHDAFLELEQTTFVLGYNEVDENVFIRFAIAPYDEDVLDELDDFLWDLSDESQDEEDSDSEVLPPAAFPEQQNDDGAEGSGSSDKPVPKCAAKEQSDANTEDNVDSCVDDDSENI